jgi:tripartite-type tricarboxylate transporter receptor subunit TctC
MLGYALKFRRHAIIVATVVALTQPALSPQAAAQDAAAIAAWPNRTLTLIVPFAAGGGVDGSARIQAQALSEILGQSIIVENIGAAAGTTGSARVSKATPDGYTFLIGNSGTHAYSQSLYKTRPYDAASDFEPIGLVSESPRILIARKDLPVANIKEFVAYAKANQDKMQFGSAGVGSGTHLPCALLNSTMGVNIAHVPYRGAGPVMQDLVGGRLDYMCDTIQTGAEQAKSGTVKGIAVMSPKRVSIIPDLPTTAEQGLPGVEALVWNAFFFPRGTQKALVDKMNVAVLKMLERPDMKQKLEALGLDIAAPGQRSPEYLAKMLPGEIERWGNVIKAAGIGSN